MTSGRILMLLFDSDWTDSDENMFVMVVVPLRVQDTVCLSLR
jgi:hypothetical protein